MREELFPLIMRAAARTVVVVRCPRGIDSRGLHKTNIEALHSSLRAVARPGAICLSDGFPVPDLGCAQRAVVGGDATSAAIAAASVLAKVTRDRYMRTAAAAHPGWEFEAHVGYSTPEHRAAIVANGVSPIHRLSFASIAYTQLSLDGSALERVGDVLDPDGEAIGPDCHADGVEADLLAVPGAEEGRA
ncbi:MAG: ribonuclease [Thermoleophilaceae bacterium]|nr:ribonuclease [Thermoleophilaceae bacterium]